MLKRTLAVGAASTISVGAYALPAAAAVDNYPEAPAESEASLVDSTLLGEGLAGGGRTTAAWDEDPGPNNEALNVDLLGNELIGIGNIEVPLDEILDFGQAGALLSESEATSPLDARAISGIAAGDGSVTLDGDDAGFGAAEIDLLSLFSAAGVDDITEDIVSEATLLFGAGGAEVIAEDGEFLDQDGVGGLGQYRVGEASVLFASPAIEEAAGMIYDTIGEMDDLAEETVNDVLDLADIIDALPGDTSLDVTVTSEMQEEIFAAILAEPITTNNEVLTVDFSTGTAELHLDQLLSGEMRPDQPTGMNNQNPNTELIDDEIYPMIAETVHDLMEEVTNITLGAVEGALGSITLDFEITLDGGPTGTATGSWSVNLMGDELEPFTCESTGVGGAALCTTLTTTFNTVVEPLVETALIPVRDFLVGDAGQELFDLLVRDIKTGAITVPIREALEPFIETLATVVSVQLNHQVEEVCEAPDGSTLTESLEVSALSIGLFEGDGARLNFGNAGARIDACGASDELELGLIVDPSEVPAGDSTTVTGDGFTPDSTATVQLTDDEGNPVGDPIEVPTDENGEFVTELPTPADAEPGDYTVVATDDTTGEEISESLVITEPDDGVEIDPSVAVDPSEVPAGEPTTVTGEGYTPDSTATVQLTDDEGNPVGDPIEVPTDENGEFVTELPTPADAEPGDYTVVGTDDTTGE
ncbi:hypothetical protein ACFWFN_07810, partial [Nesterenkonia xinjiangensis]